MKMINKASLAGISAALMLSTAALAGGGGGGGGGTGTGFASLLERGAADGRCSVSRVTVGDSTLYIPRDPSNSSARFNVLVWGNGTGGGAATYRTLLESVASHCIAVAAANTENSGDGDKQQAALNSLRSGYSNILISGHKVCTAGHSQGGGGAWNAANLINANCVIAVQPDTRYTTSIQRAVARTTEVISLTSSSDTLAPASGNRRNVERNSTILTQITTQGEGHFEPTSGRGGIIGNLFRMANIAELSTDANLAREFRGVFWGPSTSNTATSSNRDINDVRRTSAATSTNP